MWSSTVAPAGQSWAGRSRVGPSRAVPRRGGARPARLRRIRGRRRTGALLMVLGARWLARAARVRWEPVSLLAGFLIAVTGFVVPAGGGVFMLGVVVLIATLLKGINAQERRRDPAR